MKPSLYVVAEWPYFYFRVCEYGLHFMWRTKNWQPLFSERNGHEPVLELGKLRIKVLKP